MAEVEIRVVVEPDTEKWDKDDDRWRLELIDLRQTLERDMPEAVEPAPKGPDGKGVFLVPVIMALGSAGVFTAMVESLKAWLHRRPSNVGLTGQVEIDGKVMKFAVNGSNVESSELVSIVTTAFKDG
ncbi:MAG: effector-associated constant component EACC1 [Ilumatobacteraceae bacterium]